MTNQFTDAVYGRAYIRAGVSMSPLCCVWHQCTSMERLRLVVGMVSRDRANWRVA